MKRNNPDVSTVNRLLDQQAVTLMLDCDLSRIPLLLDKLIPSIDQLYVPSRQHYDHMALVQAEKKINKYFTNLYIINNKNNAVIIKIS